MSIGLDRIGGWSQSAGGRPFWACDPRPEDVHLDDIVHALSHLCRYGGHCRKFYSVLEHSVLVSMVVPTEHARDALGHDFTEAYVVDVPRPLKRALKDYAAIEWRNWVAICSALGFSVVRPRRRQRRAPGREGRAARTVACSVVCAWGACRCHGARTSAAACSMDVLGALA